MRTIVLSSYFRLQVNHKFPIYLFTLYSYEEQRSKRSDNFSQPSISFTIKGKSQLLHLTEVVLYVHVNRLPVC